MTELKRRCCINVWFVQKSLAVGGKASILVENWKDAGWEIIAPKDFPIS